MLYDPHDFYHGIETLETVDAEGDAERRDAILHRMWDLLDDLNGDWQDDLLDYIAELLHHPERPVDFYRLHRLHHEFAAVWGSAMGAYMSEEAQRLALEALQDRDAEEQRKKTLNAIPGAEANAAIGRQNKACVHQWLDEFYGQARRREYSTSELARLMRRDIDLGLSTLRAHIEKWKDKNKT